MADHQQLPDEYKILVVVLSKMVVEPYKKLKDQELKTMEMRVKELEKRKTGLKLAQFLLLTNIEWYIRIQPSSRLPNLYANKPDEKSGLLGIYRKEVVKKA